RRSIPEDWRAPARQIPAQPGSGGHHRPGQHSLELRRICHGKMNQSNSDPRPPTPVCTGPLPSLGLSRRHFLNCFGMGRGGIALAHLLTPAKSFAAVNSLPHHQGIITTPHFPPKAKRVIYLFMAGGPSQLETFDYKPLLNQRNGEGLPESVRMGQRLTG